MTWIIGYNHMKKNKEERHDFVEKEILALWKNASPRKRLRILELFDRQIAFLQHERIVHLLVTLFFGGASLFLGWAVLISVSLYLPIVFIAVLAVTFFYVIYYYRLENACQRWQKTSIGLEKESLAKKK